MKTSDGGVKFIASQEGFVPHVYLDQASIPTIGYGHVMRPGDPTTVTVDQALAMLHTDVGYAEEAVNLLVRVPLSQNAFDALVSFTFNVGTGSLSTSALLHLLNQGRSDQAADEFLKWDHIMVRGRLVVSDGLKQRRTLERIMFLTPDPVVSVGPPIAPNDAPPVMPDDAQHTTPDELPPTDE
jgi:lysozyme